MSGGAHLAGFLGLWFGLVALGADLAGYRVEGVLTQAVQAGDFKGSAASNTEADGRDLVGGGAIGWSVLLLQPDQQGAAEGVHVGCLSVLSETVQCPRCLRLLSLRVLSQPGVKPYQATSLSSQQPLLLLLLQVCACCHQGCCPRCQQGHCCVGEETERAF